jgi:predicted AAA+ superfamily ATPase
MFLNKKSKNEIKIYLVEGYQGSGKSFYFQNLIIKESKRRSTLFISLRNLVDKNWEK